MTDHLPQPSLKTPPVPPRIRWVLWLMVVASISLVAGVVLLSNDMRHLRSIALRLGLHLAEPEVAQMAKPRPTRKPAGVKVAPELFTTSVDPASGVFIPATALSGQALCQGLKDDGVDVSAWEEAAFGGGTFECSYEAEKSDGAIQRSLFLLVRGNQMGEVSNVRMKLVNPELDSDHLTDATSALVGKVLSMSGVANPLDLSEKIRKLQPFKDDSGGLSVALSKELTDKPSFNLIISRNRQLGPQSRSYRYFSATSWLAMPDTFERNNPYPE